MNKKTLNILVILAMIKSAFGMLFCFPFLSSGNMAHLVGAEFPFVGVAILFGSGFLIRAVFNRNQ
tara:strand:- start:394 stop:588 length:195 start_codon:yes stop_codon:yes gene_type:complete